MNFITELCNLRKSKRVSDKESERAYSVYIHIETHMTNISVVRTSIIRVIEEHFLRNENTTPPQCFSF